MVPKGIPDLWAPLHTFEAQLFREQPGLERLTESHVFGLFP